PFFLHPDAAFPVPSPSLGHGDEYKRLGGTRVAAQTNIFQRGLQFILHRSPPVSYDQLTLPPTD
uniref:hypothetical protein n=1 Tax=Escherichia coli TaxID=562 RepID=UPI001964D155